MGYRYIARSRLIWRGVFVLLCLITTSVSAQPSLRQGDNLAEYIKSFETLYFKGQSKISLWIEGEINIYATSAEAEEDQPKIIMSHNGYPFAVMQGKSPDVHYLIDTTGDRILNLTRKHLFVPFWVVYENSATKNQDEGILKIMDLMYIAFQSDQGPSENPDMKEAFSLIESCARDKEKANRDLVYIVFFYSGFGPIEPEQSLYLLTALRDQCQERLGKVHPLNDLFIAESLIRLNRKKEALILIETLLKGDPAFVPAMVYRYQLENNPEKAGALLSELKEKHGDHWLVKRL